MTDIASLYLDTLKNTLIDMHRCGGYNHRTVINAGPFHLTRATRINPLKRVMGEDWPENAESMIGLKRMDNIQYCIAIIIRDNIPGHMLEAGVWRGGASIFMKANLKVHGSDKHLYLCDSFCGLPLPTLPQDAGDDHHKYKYLKAGPREVRENFVKYGLLDPGVKFIHGWFKNTMPLMRDLRFSLLRLDGDMYESTMDVLTNVYDCLVPGGFIIIDDFALWPCKRAVLEFRAKRKIHDEIIEIDNIGVYWRKTK